jgi:hypothetical protein
VCRLLRSLAGESSARSSMASAPNTGLAAAPTAVFESTASVTTGKSRSALAIRPTTTSGGAAVRWSVPRPSRDDVNEQVSAALRGLPALERRLVEIHHYQEKTITQAAKELGICRPWTSRLHARALATLRATLEGKSLPLPPERRNAPSALDRPEGVSRRVGARNRNRRMIGEGVAR